MSKKINQGSEVLIQKSKWVNAREIQGNDKQVLQHPIMEEAFQKILMLHKPKHKICLVSLCTSTRPYSKSRKWKKYKELFSDYADLIVCSNGGIIPLEFENCYPYLTYDAHGEKKYDVLYCKIVYQRLLAFFNKHHYDCIVFNFRPTIRNRACAIKFEQTYQGDSKIYILPTVSAYKDAQRRGFPNGDMFPDLDKVILNELITVIKQQLK